MIKDLCRIDAQLRREPITFQVTIHGKKRTFRLDESWLASLLMDYDPDLQRCSRVQR